MPAFLKPRLNFQHFKKKMTLIADVFPMLQTPKRDVKKMSKKYPLRGPFNKQRVRGTKH